MNAKKCTKKILSLFFQCDGFGMKGDDSFFLLWADL